MESVDRKTLQQARVKDHLRKKRTELRAAKRVLGAGLVRLVEKDADFAAALLSMLRARSADQE